MFSIWVYVFLIRYLFQYGIQGLVSLVSREGTLQLNVFISVLAVFHVLYCILTMFLGMAKVSELNFLSYMKISQNENSNYLIITKL